MDTLKPLPDPVALRYVATLAEDAKKAAAEATAARAIAQSAQEEARLKDEEAKEKELVAEKKRITVEAAVQDALWMEPSKAKHLPIDPTVERPSDPVLPVQVEEKSVLKPISSGRVIHVLMISTLDFIHQHALVTNGSEMRIQRAIEAVEQGDIPRDAYIVWPQGFGKDNPTKPTYPTAVSLGKNYADHCVKQPALKDMHPLQKEMGWGTLDDMWNAYVLVAEAVPDIETASVHFHFVTDPTHMRRVKQVWEKTCPSHWEASFYETSVEVLSQTDRWFREPVARLVYWGKLLRAERFNVPSKSGLEY